MKLIRPCLGLLIHVAIRICSATLARSPSRIHRCPQDSHPHCIVSRAVSCELWISHVLTSACSLNNPCYPSSLLSVALHIDRIKYGIKPSSHLPSHKIIDRFANPAGFKPGQVSRRMKLWKTGRTSGIQATDIWTASRLPLFVAVLAACYHIYIWLYGYVQDRSCCLCVRCALHSLRWLTVLLRLVAFGRLWSPTLNSFSSGHSYLILIDYATIPIVPSDLNRTLSSS